MYQTTTPTVGPPATREGIQTDSSDDDDENEGEEPVEVVPPPAAGAGHDGGEGGSEAARAADARRRAANAALARLTASQHRPALATAVSTGTAPVAAGAAAVSALNEEAAQCAGMDEKKEQEKEEEVEVDLEGLTEVAGEHGAKLLVAAGVKTLGQLADRDEEELARELAVLEQKQQQQENGVAPESADGCGGGAGASGGGSGSTGEGQRIDAEQVSEWVQSARGEELDEIMADIVGDDEGVVEVRARRRVVGALRPSKRSWLVPFVWGVGVRFRVLGGRRALRCLSTVTVVSRTLFRRSELICSPLDTFILKGRPQKLLCVCSVYTRYSNRADAVHTLFAAEVLLVIWSFVPSPCLSFSKLERAIVPTSGP